MGSPAFKAGVRCEPSQAGSIPVHLRWGQVSLSLSNFPKGRKGKGRLDPLIRPGQFVLIGGTRVDVAGMAADGL